MISPLSRAILAPKDILLDSKEAQKLALIFDHIYLWPIYRREFLTNEELVRLEAELEYLVDQQIVSRVGFDRIIGYPMMQTGNNDNFCDPSLFTPFDDEIDITISLNDSAKKMGIDHNRIFFEHPGYEEDDPDTALRVMAGFLEHDGAPVAASLNSFTLSSKSTGVYALEVTINEVPLPPQNMPWADLIQFRNEGENIAKLRKLRIWMQDRAITKSSPSQVRDELLSLIDDYTKYMKIQHKRYGSGPLSTLVLTCAETLGHLTKLNIGDVLSSAFRVRDTRLKIHEAELIAPGREVAYLSTIKEHLLNE